MLMIRLIDALENAHNQIKLMEIIQQENVYSNAQTTLLLMLIIWLECVWQFVTTLQKVAGQKTTQEYVLKNVPISLSVIIQHAIVLDTVQMASMDTLWIMCVWVLAPRLILVMTLLRNVLKFAQPPNFYSGR